MIDIAYFSLHLALVCAAYTLGASLASLRANRPALWLQSAERGILAIAGLFSLAVLLLLNFLVQRDFRVAYVVAYTDLALPLPYVISALWAGQRGSLLFWGWVSSLCSLVFLRQRRALTDRERPYAYSALALTLGFFLILLIVVANPFVTVEHPPADGQGMNPLLQNMYMAVHPPVLFIGYAAFLIPFVLSLATLCTGTMRKEWAAFMRGWNLFAWYCLGIGIVLGAQWAYLELGWGGYWSWDPVENASLIPWLSSTALIHTLILQRWRGSMRLWNLVLGILNFLLCIVATFITRSGLIDSVHAFGQSVIGFYFMAFLALIVAIAAALIISRRKRFRSAYEVSSLLSKDGSFLLTNQLLIGLSFAVLYGTVYAFLSELLGGRKITIDASFYNRIGIPIGLMLLGLLAVCQGVSWKSSASKSFQVASLAAFPVTLALYGLGIHHWPTLLTWAFSICILLTALLEIGNVVIRPVEVPKQPFIRRTLTAITARKPRYIGFVIHAGTALLYIGIAMSSAYKLEHTVRLSPQQSASLGGYDFRYTGLSRTIDRRKAVVAANIVVANGGESLATLLPEKHFYGEDERGPVTTESAVRSSLLRDIYVVLLGWEEDDTATLALMIYPCVQWIWIGGFAVYTLGMLIAFLPHSHEPNHP